MGSEQQPVLAFRFDADVAAGRKTAARHVILAYDDLYSIEYVHRRLRPFRRHKGVNAGDLLGNAERAERRNGNGEDASFNQPPPLRKSSTSVTRSGTRNRR